MTTNIFAYKVPVANLSFDPYNYRTGDVDRDYSRHLLAETVTAAERRYEAILRSELGAGRSYHVAVRAALETYDAIIAAYKDRTRRRSV